MRPGTTLSAVCGLALCVINYRPRSCLTCLFVCGLRCERLGSVLLGAGVWRSIMVRTPVNSQTLTKGSDSLDVTAPLKEVHVYPGPLQLLGLRHQFLLL
jgi:hypothetical protein